MNIASMAISASILLAGCTRPGRPDDNPQTYHITLPHGHPNAVALSSERGAPLAKSVLYTERGVFLNFIASLNSGSVLEHDAGCAVPVSYHFKDGEMKIPELEEFCMQRGIKIRIYGSW